VAVKNRGTVALAQDEVIDWLLWYNCSRRHSTLGYVSPLRFEENWQADQARQASA